MLLLMARALSCSPTTLESVPVSRLVAWAAELERINTANKPTT